MLMLRNEDSIGDSEERKDRKDVGEHFKRRVKTRAGRGE
jgi:hypothetical protein